jgi:4-hydroxybenzoate polyprenyltransferase
MKAWYAIKIMRPVNLVIIGLTMGIFHYFFMKSIHAPLAEGELVWGIWVLVLSTMMIAGAGNMINDYFDIRIDRVNKPDDIIVDKYIKRREVMLMHVVLNTLAVAAGIFLWIKYETWIPAAVHVFTTTTLWMYSVVLKRKFLIGNLAIALLTALVPLLIFWFEAPVIYAASPEAFLMVKKIVYVYSGFAFITTLIREIQKDFADEEGDRMHGCKTVPIVMGAKGKWLVIGLQLLVVVLIGVILAIKPFLLQHPAALMLLTVLLPLVASLFISLRANNRHAWLRASNSMKLVMLGGVLFLGIFIYVA